MEENSKLLVIVRDTKYILSYYSIDYQFYEEDENNYAFIKDIKHSTNTTGTKLPYYLVVSSYWIKFKCFLDRFIEAFSYDNRYNLHS